VDQKLRGELERIAFAEATSGRAQLAKLGAIRMLERLDRGDEIAIPLDSAGRFHPSDDPRWHELDAGDSDETRAQWLESWLAEGRR
jgi:hypothetical protein